MKVRCIAVDDEFLSLDLTRKYIQKIPFLELLDTFESAVPAIAYLKQHTVDLIFLDIQMKELTGMQLLKSLNSPPLVILTTAYESYAVESYELNVLDYLLKPISFERFVKAIDKAYNRLVQALPPGKNVEKGITITNRAEDFFFIKSGTNLERVAYEDILFIKGERDYLKIVTHQKNILVLLTFKYFEDLLPKDQFFRVHKSYMVAVDKINCIDGNLIQIKDFRIPMGSIYRASFLHAIMKQK